MTALNVLAKLLHHPIQWDSETIGCQPSLSSIPAAEQRTLLTAMQELADWLAMPQNEQEFLIVFFDDQMDLAAWVRGLCLTQCAIVFWVLVAGKMSLCGASPHEGALLLAELFVNSTLIQKHFQQAWQLIPYTVLNYRQTSSDRCERQRP